MDEIGLFDAKNKLSELVDRAERGEETIVAGAGKPVAKLVPVQPVATGKWRGTRADASANSPRR